jgi:hypothetical protein
MNRGVPLDASHPILFSALSALGVPKRRLMAWILIDDDRHRRYRTRIPSS